MKQSTLATGLLTVFVDAKSTPISHIIVLMMENRSFDHMLGWLKSSNPSIEGLQEGA